MGYILNIFHCIGIIVNLFFHKIFFYTILLFVVALYLLLITPRFTAWMVAFRANRWWYIVCGEFKKETSEGKETTSESTTGSTSESEVTVDEWEVVNPQAQQMLNTAVDHTVLPNISTLDTAANAWEA